MIVRSAKYGMIVLMKRKRMNKLHSIQINIPSETLSRAALLSIVMETSRSKVFNDIVIQALNKKYKSVLHQKVINRIKVELCNRPYLKNQIIQRWRQKLTFRGVPTKECETLLNKAIYETYHTHHP